MTAILLRNATLVDGTVPEPREGCHVAIEDGLIVAVGDGPGSAGEEAQVIDLEGRTLMPGLIDAHVHVTATTLDFARLQSEPASYNAVKARAIMRAMLDRGFTTVRDAGGADWGLAMAVEHGLIEGPRLIYSGRALSQTGGHGDLRPRVWNLDICACCALSWELAVIADGVDAVRRAAREELRRGAKQIKIMASGGVASPRDPVWNLQYSDEEITAAVWEAKSWRTYVMAHAYTPEAVSRAVHLGVRSIEHGNLIDQATAELMAEKQAWLVPTLATYEAMHREGADYSFPKRSLEKLADVRDAGLRAVELAKAAGVRMGFGTDLLGESHRHQSLEFSLRAEVASPHEVIRCATLDNAELLNLAGEIGVIAEGARADLIAVDGNPLEDLNLLQEQGRHLRLIMAGGRLHKNELA